MMLEWQVLALISSLSELSFDCRWIVAFQTKSFQAGQFLIAWSIKKRIFRSLDTELSLILIFYKNFHCPQIDC